MTYQLFIGDRLFSSWSLRGWLLFSKFNIPMQVQHVRMYSDQFEAYKKAQSPAKTVPSIVLDDQILWDSLAIAETLAERHPDAGMWPTDDKARYLARSISAEMHSSFGALRSNCPMDIRHIYEGYQAPEDVKADVERIEMLWALARQHAGDGPWLFGSYSIADVMYAPVVMRFATYGLAQSKQTKAYMETVLSDSTFRQWRAMGFAENYQQTVYDRDLPKADWPGPTPLIAKAVDGTESKNTKCPYSGKAITHVLDLDGTRWGFCNAFCRDKTVADPAAWPAFMDMINQT